MIRWREMLHGPVSGTKRLVLFAALPCSTERRVGGRWAEFLVRVGPRQKEVLI